MVADDRSPSTNHSSSPDPAPSADRFSATLSARLTSLTRSAAGVRGRSTLLAAVVVAVALAIGAAGMLAVYRNQLRSSLDSALTQQVSDRVRLLENGSPAESLATVIEEESLVWIGTADGTAIATGGSILPVGDPIPSEVGTVETIDLLFDELYSDDDSGELEREQGSVRIASAATADGVIVLAGAEVETVDGAVTTIGRLFAFGIPPVVALVAALTWLTTGRALKPVENIRFTAAEITGTNLAGRVPVPDGDDEIAQLAITMNAMLERIESHEYSLRQFTADASHELKSPVANLRALVDTAGLSDAEWPALKRHLLGESDRLKDLVENLLFLASHEAGRPVGQPESVALDELLFVEAELAAATGTVTVDLAGVQPAMVAGSTRDVARLVRNLVDNATRHAASRIAISVDTANAGPDGSTVTLIIGDDGPGIAPEDRERVFERFSRLDDARNRGDGGAGLGLAIVRTIAEAHRADVTVGSSPLGGAELRVRFPTA